MQSGETITFLGCDDAASPDRDCGYFSVAYGGREQRVEVRTTAQIEHMLARELGQDQLTDDQREAVLSEGGRRLIESYLERGQPLEPVVLLDSRILMTPGAERRLLQASGLLPREHGAGHYDEREAADRFLAWREARREMREVLAKHYGEADSVKEAMPRVPPQALREIEDAYERQADAWQHWIRYVRAGHSAAGSRH